MARFLTLPLELRLEIYDRVLASQSGEEITLGTIACETTESKAHQFPKSDEPRVCLGRSESILFENITALPSDSKSTQTAQDDSNELQWSPFALLETCRQIRAELATHLRLRWRARFAPVKKLWVSYPLGATLLDGVYAPLISAADEVVVVGSHDSDVSDIQLASIHGLEHCIRAFESSRLKGITTRIYFPGTQQDAYLRSVSGTSPFNTMVGINSEDVKLDMSVWRGKAGVAWVVDLKRRDHGLISSVSKAYEADGYRHRQVDDEDEGYASGATTPGGRQVIMRWPSWWDGENWMGVLKGEGKEFGSC